MEHAHTPGPWRVFNHRAPLGETGDYENVIYVISGRPVKQTVCYCNEIGEDEEEVSNANLIACAPEMLDLLVEVAKKISDSDHWWMSSPDTGGFDFVKIKDLIQKATQV